MIAVDLLIEVLGVEGLGRAGNPGDDQQGKKGGRDRLHGNLLSSGSKECPQPTRLNDPQRGGPLLSHAPIAGAVPEGTRQGKLWRRPDGRLSWSAPGR